MPNVDLMYSFVFFSAFGNCVLYERLNFVIPGNSANFRLYDICWCMFLQQLYSTQIYAATYKHSGTQETRDHPHVEIITELSGCCKLYQFTVNSTYVSSLLAPFTPILCHQEEEKLRQFLPLPKSIFLYLCDWRLGIKNRNENRSSC